jgi:hypothetical protein
VPSKYQANGLVLIDSLKCITSNDDSATSSSSPGFSPDQIMRLSWFRLGSIVAAALSIRARATPAPITDGNPIGVEYVARLAPGSAGPITGSVIIVTTPSNDGRGADVRVGISGLPASGGPFRESYILGQLFE